jgi:hypothetical protein
VTPPTRIEYSPYRKNQEKVNSKPHNKLSDDLGDSKVQYDHGYESAKFVKMLQKIEEENNKTYLFYDVYEGINISLTKLPPKKGNKVNKGSKLTKNEEVSLDYSKEWLCLAMAFLLVNDELGAFVINHKVKIISKVILYLNLFVIFTSNFFE